MWIWTWLPVAFLSQSGQIPAGYEAVQITDDPTSYANHPQLNNCGEVVFGVRIGQEEDLEEIFYFDNGRMQQLTDDDPRNAYPDINDLGTIVWTREAGNYDANEIMMLSDGMISTLGLGSSPEVNNLGYVGWKRFNPVSCASPSNIFLFDGLSVQQITDDGLSNQVVDFNGNGELVWTRYDFCQQPWWTSTIMHYMDGVTTELSDNVSDPQSPSINDIGTVVWTYTFDPDTGQNAIHMLKDGGITMLTDWGDGPIISNAGDVLFTRWHNDLNAWQVWLWRNGEFSQLTDSPLWNIPWGINDYGEAVWMAASFPESEIVYMRRIRTGEADFDGHIDLKDAAAFQNCYTGEGDFDGIEGGFDRLCDCRFLDIDHDRDVDADDYALFATAMTGPE